MSNEDFMNTVRHAFRERDYFPDIEGMERKGSRVKNPQDRNELDYMIRHLKEWAGHSARIIRRVKDEGFNKGNTEDYYSKGTDSFLESLGGLRAGARREVSGGTIRLHRGMESERKGPLLKSCVTCKDSSQIKLKSHSRLPAMRFNLCLSHAHPEWQYNQQPGSYAIHKLVRFKIKVYRKRYQKGYNRWPKLPGETT